MVNKNEFDIIVQTGFQGIQKIENRVSINDQGKVAFVGDFDVNAFSFNAVFIGDESGVTQISNTANSINQYGTGVQINNQNQIIAVKTGQNVGSVYLYDGNSFNSFEVIATAGGSQSGTSYPFDFFSVLPISSVNNQGESVFVAFEEEFAFDVITGARYELGDRYLVSASTPPSPSLEQKLLPGSISATPLIADNGNVVVSEVINGVRQILLYNHDLNPLGTIASSTTGFTNIGLNPGISDDGRIIVFIGNKTQGVDRGEGIFASILNPNNNSRTIFKIAGISGDGILDPGESFTDNNNNGIFDSGDNDIGAISSFTINSRIGVNNSGEVVYIGIDSNGKERIYSSTITSTLAVGSPELIVQVGEKISDTTGAIEDLEIYDPINNEGKIAFWAKTSTEEIVTVVPPPGRIIVEKSWGSVQQGFITFKVNLTSPLTEDLVLNYFTLDGSANSTGNSGEKTDFTNLANGILTFRAGRTTPEEGEITISLLNNEQLLTEEEFEYFSRNTAYKDWPKLQADVDTGKDSGYRVDKFFKDGSTGFEAVGLTSRESFYLLVSSSTQSKFVNQQVSGGDFLQEVSKDLGEDTNASAYKDAEIKINQLIASGESWTFATGNVYDENRPPILAVRGTEPTSIYDLYSDTNPNGVGYNQFIANISSVSNWLKNITQPENKQLNFKTHITGHSLGGALSQWIAADYLANSDPSLSLGKVVVFNSPAISNAGANKIDLNRVDNIEINLMSGDVISMVGDEYLPGDSGKTTVNLFDYNSGGAGGTLNTHSVPMYLASSGNLTKPPSLQTPRKLTSAQGGDDYFTYLPDPDYFSLLVLVSWAASNLSALGVPISQPFGIPPEELAPSLMFRVTTESGRQKAGENIAKLVGSINNLSSVILQKGIDAYNSSRNWGITAWNTVINEALTLLDIIIPSPSIPVTNPSPSTSVTSIILSTSEMSSSPQDNQSNNTVDNFWETVNNFSESSWQALAVYPDKAWQAMGKWGEAGWSAMSKWTAENWNASKQFTEAKWQETETFSSDDWNKLFPPSENIAPVALNDVVTTNQDTSITINVLSNDSDVNQDLLTVSLISNPSNGQAIVSNNLINYTPNLGFKGTDNLGYSISDGRGGTASAGVSITVNAINQNYPSYVVRQLTNSDDSWGVQGIAISGNYIAWYASPVGDAVFPSNFYLYDGNTTIKIPDSNIYNPIEFSILGNKLVWINYDEEGDHEIYSYDGNTTKKISDNNLTDAKPKFWANKIVWLQQNEGSSMSENYDVYLYDGRFTQPLTSDNHPDDKLKVSPDQNRIAWVKTYLRLGYPSTADEADLFIFDGTNITNLSSNLGQTSQNHLFTDNGIFWTERYYTNNGLGNIQQYNESYFYDGVSVTKIPIENAEGFDPISFRDYEVVGNIGNNLVLIDSYRGRDIDPNTTQLALIYDPDTNKITPITDQPDIVSVKVSGNKILLWRLNSLELYENGHTTTLSSYAVSSVDISGDRIVWHSKSSDYGEPYPNAFLATIATTDTPTISINDAAIVEGNTGTKELGFNVALSKSMQERVKVSYETIRDTAVEGSDFNTISGSLIFNPGETNKTISVAVKGDLQLENDETFSLKLLNPINAIFAKQQAVGTIYDSDPTIDDYLKSDFDGDGDPEIVMKNRTNPWNGAMMLDGTKYLRWEGLPSAPAPWEAIAIADMDGDGNQDIVVNHKEFGWNGVLRLNGTSYLGWANLPPTAPGWKTTGVGDFNNDGFSDILVQNIQHGWNSVMSLKGTDSSYEQWLNLPSTLGWQPVGVGDMNKDGFDDILLYNPSSSKTGLLLLKGTQSVGWSESLPATTGWIPVGLADFNRDTNLDILIHNTQNDWTGAFFMNGNNYLGYTGMPSATGWTPLV